VSTYLKIYLVNDPVHASGALSFSSTTIMQQYSKISYQRILFKIRFTLRNIALLKICL